MRRKTFAFNGITIGTLLGILIGVTTESVALGIVAAIGISAAAYFAIKWIENLMYKGVDAAGQAMKNAYQQRKANNAASQAMPTQAQPNQVNTAQNTVAQNNQSEKKFCTSCGTQLDKDMMFCTKCGTKQL